jgi:hypothetical protein
MFSCGFQGNYGVFHVHVGKVFKICSGLWTSCRKTRVFGKGVGKEDWPAGEIGGPAWIA